MGKMTLRTKKKISVFLLSVLIFFSFLMGGSEGLPGQIPSEFENGREVSLSGSRSGAESIKSVDEVSPAVLHAVLLRRITHRQAPRIQRFIAKLFAAVEFFALLLVVECCLRPVQNISRVILIRFIHRSDGKK